MQQLNLPLQATQPDSLTVLKYPLPGITNNWDFLHDLARQLQMQKDPQGRRQDLCLLQPAHGREEWSEGNFETPLFDEGPARKPPPQRGRPDGQEGRHRRGIEVAAQEVAGA